DAEGDVGDQDGAIAGAHPDHGEEDQAGDGGDDLGHHERQVDQREAGGAAPEAAAAHHGQAGGGGDQRGGGGGQQRDGQRVAGGKAEAGGLRPGEDIRIPAPGKPAPLGDRGRSVEAVGGDD